MFTIKKSLISTALLGISCLVSAQVSVNGQNVSVATGDGTAVNVNGSRVTVNTPKQGQTAVAVGSGRTAVNVGSGNVVVNSAGSVNTGASGKDAGRDQGKAARNKPRKADKNSDKDEAFWGKGGFWGENGK